MKTTALIMAGGRGERFWPRSRTSLPKQFLALTDETKTMIRLTVDRILPLVAAEDIYIATNRRYRDLVREQLPEIPETNILCEPVGRNTAPCIGLAAFHMRRKDEDAVMMVLSSDHLIEDVDAFRHVLTEAAAVAEQGRNLVTIGITPTYPETGYGYVCCDRAAALGAAFKVQRFVEKPDRERAAAYLASGDYLWNSGMFVWKLSTILGNLETHMPELYAGLAGIAEAIGTAEEDAVLERCFPALPSQSIDYGVLEKASDIYILPGSFGWDDVGSWPALARIQGYDPQGNAIRGNVTAVDSGGCILQSDGKLIAAVGLKDLIVIDTDDVTLICPKDRAGDIKKLLAELKEQHKETYL